MAGTVKDSPFTEEQTAFVTSVKNGLRVTKVVCTRGIKTKAGDFFVGFAAAWDTIQDDGGGQGVDLVDTMEPEETATAVGLYGKPLKEARVAACILGTQVELQALGQAFAGNGISETEYRNATAATRQRYGRLLVEAVGSAKPEPTLKLATGSGR